MKYYSEKLDRNFDTVEELEEAEEKLGSGESNKEELIAEINEKIDEKIEEFREVEKKTQEIITEIADLVIELTNIDPAQFLRSFEIVRKLHEISDEVYSDSHAEKGEGYFSVENNEPSSKEEKFDEETFKNFLNNLIKNLNE